MNSNASLGVAVMNSGDLSKLRRFVMPGKRLHVAQLMTVLLVILLAVMGTACTAGLQQQQTNRSQVATPSAPATVAADAPAPIEGKAGYVAAASGYEAAVAGGKYLTVGESRLLALKIYVRGKGADLTDFDTSLAVEDAAGALIPLEHGALDTTTLVPQLDTKGWRLRDGDETGGWVAFKLGEGTKPAYLIIGGSGEGYSSDLAPLRISLAGFDTIPALSVIDQQYLRASKIGGGWASAASVTMQEYNLVKQGMSLKKVNGIVGFEGKELSQSGSDSSFSWSNHDGGNMTVTFSGGHVQSKTQSGL